MQKIRFFVGIALAASAASAQDWPEMPPARVEVAAAEMRDLAPLVEVSGTVVSLNDSRIAAEVEGVLTWLAEVGDDVDAGAVIARVDPRLIKVELDRARANVLRLEADLRYREQQLKRTEDLAAADHASATLLDESRAQRDQALHLLAEARAQLVRAEGDLERSEIRAPFAGHIVERVASVGEYINVGEDVLRLVDTHQTEIALPAAISIAAYVSPGLEVLVRGNGVERSHPVRAVVPVGDPVSRMVEIRLTAEDGDWLVGAPVQVSLPSRDATRSVAVPRDALVQRGGAAFVFKVTAEGTAEQIPADLRRTVGMWVGIDQGIEPGDQVIIRGAERLAPGQAVEIITTTAAN